MCFPPRGLWGGCCVMGGVTSDVFGVGSSGLGPGAGSGVCDGEGVQVVGGGLVGGPCVLSGALGRLLA